MYAKLQAGKKLHDHELGGNGVQSPHLDCQIEISKWNQ